MNKAQSKVLWKHLSITKGFQKTLNKNHNTKLLDIDMAILIFIGSHTRIAIIRIVKHKYFKQYGFSTIKRSVGRLISLNFVKQGQWKLDERKKLLSVNFDFVNMVGLSNEHEDLL
jgi:hypothetical protein